MANFVSTNPADLEEKKKLKENLVTAFQLHLLIDHELNIFGLSQTH